MKRDHSAPLAVVALALAATTAAIWSHLSHPADKTDFYARYSEGTAWRQGQPLYTWNPTLNTHPPIVTAAVFAPLSIASYRSAQIGSIVLNVIGMSASIAVVIRTLGLDVHRSLWLIGLLLAFSGTLQHWALGQFIGILMYPVTRAWAAHRAGRPYAAGVWLAPVVIAKPPLALLALLLPLRTCVATGLLGAGITLAGIWWTGVEPWLLWIRAGRDVNWIALPANASLWGLAARWQQGHCGWITMRELSVWAVATVIAIAALLVWHAARQTNRDVRFLCAGLFSTLLSPLGWTYYLPLMAAPAAASWPGSRLAVIAYLMLQAPVATNQPDTNIVLGSVICVGTLVSWLAWTTSPSAATPTAAAAVTPSVQPVPSV